MFPRVEAIEQGIVMSNDLLESQRASVGGGMAVGG